MSKVMGGPLNHLSSRRRGRTPLHYPPLAPPWPPYPCPAMGNIQDCYFDYERADPSVCVTICELLSDPCIVSQVMTGYIEHCPGLANQVLMAAGEDGPTGANNDG